MPLVRGERLDDGDRLFRCDSRLMLQSGRATAIRGGSMKYIRYHDERGAVPTTNVEADGEVLIDLQADPEEERNLLADPSRRAALHPVLERFRSEFERSERRAMEFQVRHLLARQQRTMEGSLAGGQDGARILVLFEPSTAAFTDVGVAALERTFTRAEILVVSDRPKSAVGSHSPRVRFVPLRLAEDRLVVEGLDPGPVRGGFALAILFVQKSGSKIARDLRDLARAYGAGRPLLVDCNFDAQGRGTFWLNRLRAVARRLPRIVAEPRLILREGAEAARWLRRYALRRLGMWERWDGARPPRSPASRNDGRERHPTGVDRCEGVSE